MTVEVKQLKGSGTVPFGVPFRNVYILNDGGKGWIRINDTLKLDIEKIDRVEGLTIKKLEWNLTSDGNAVFVILSHEKLSTEYITRLMLSRIYSELQTKSSKKKIVPVNATSVTTVSAGSSETITIQPPQGKLWRIIGLYVSVSSPQGASTGSHRLLFIRPLPQWNYLIFSANYNAGIYKRNVCQGTMDSGDSAERASEKMFFEHSYFSDSVKLTIRYENNTDADQTNPRIIGLLVEEEDGAP